MKQRLDKNTSDRAGLIIISNSRLKIEEANIYKDKQNILESKY